MLFRREPSLHLNPDLKAAALRPLFQRCGRLHIPSLLAPRAAQTVAHTLATTRNWRRTFNAGSESYDMPVDDVESLPSEQRVNLIAAAVEGARKGFQYLFDNIRVDDAVRGGLPVEPALASLFSFLNGSEFLDFVRELTGDDRAVYCDAQATRYLPGHFLTAHDDARSDKNRLYAYVLNFTAEWRADWGGLLIFIDEDGHVAEGYTPAFNALNIFRVPQLHAVSYVAPYARFPRLSVTGWVRSIIPVS